jgi:hypothetical protein
MAAFNVSDVSMRMKLVANLGSTWYVPRSGLRADGNAGWIPSGCRAPACSICVVSPQAKRPARDRRRNHADRRVSIHHQGIKQSMADSWVPVQVLGGQTSIPSYGSVNTISLRLYR